MSIYANENRGSLQAGLMDDGIYIIEGKMRVLLQKIRDTTGLRIEIKDNTERVDRMVMWLNKCWTCGALRK